MSNEILLGKLSANRTVDVESPIVVEKKKEKKKRQGGPLLFLMAVGLAALALTSLTLLAPPAIYGHVDSPGGIDDSGGGAMAQQSYLLLWQLLPQQQMVKEQRLGITV